MIALYCRHCLQAGVAPEEYRRLADYACRRLDHCRFGEHKPDCRSCPIHCYAPHEREAIRRVMRWAGPRMLWYYPADTLAYMLRKLRRWLLRW